MESPVVEVIPGLAADPAVARVAVHQRVEAGVLLVLRDATRSALAAGTTGVVVLGIGGRVVMRLAALLDPASAGSLTENGNRIGTISLEGTLALIVFGGLFPGLIGAIVWGAVAPLIPGRGLRRATLVAPIAVALSAFMLVESDNPDFLILGNDAVVIAMLLGLIAIFGFALALVDDRLDRLLPPASRTPRGLVLGYAAIVLVGAALILPLAVGFYFSREVCGCGEPPVAIGLALLVAGATTVAWWVARARGRRQPATSLAVVGGLAVVTGVAFGTLRLAEEVGRILGRG